MFKTSINPLRLLQILCIALILVASYNFNEFLFNDTWVQRHPHAALIFIPSFIKLLMILVFGWYGLTGVILGTLYLMDKTGTIYIMVLNVIVFACAPMIALLITNKIFKLSATYDNLKYYHIMMLSLISALFGVLNGVLVHDCLDSGISMMVGDFATDMILLFSFSVILRGWEFFTQGKRYAKTCKR